MTNETSAILKLIVFFAIGVLLALYYGNMGVVITCIGVIIVLALGVMWEQRRR